MKSFIEKFKKYAEANPVKTGLMVAFVVGVFVIFTSPLKDTLPFMPDKDSEEASVEESVEETQTTTPPASGTAEGEQDAEDTEESTEADEEDSGTSNSNGFLEREGYIVVDEDNVYTVKDEKNEEIIEQVVIDEEAIDYYREVFTNNESEFNELLISYNSHLNKLFTGEVEQETFFVELNRMINTSNGLIVEMESQIAPEGFDEFHNYYLTYISNIHNLLLNTSDTVEEAISDRKRVDRRDLRDNYLTVKKEQTQMVRYAMNPVEVTQEEVDKYGK